MEAAHIPWRPLGRLLVEQGLLTDQELEFALAKQQTTGRRLGETIVECGFVSSPDLSNALAAQYGIELMAETGFGTGLRAQIQRRHESDRGRPALVSVPDSQEPAEEPLPEFAEPEAPPPGETVVLAQLEEQWAKLAAAEEWLAEREVELAVLAAERDRRRAQAERLSRRARGARMELLAERERNEELRGLAQVVEGQVGEQRAKLAAAEERLAERERESAALIADRDRRRAQVGRFVQRVWARDIELQRRNEELRGLAQAVDGQVDEQRAELNAAEERLAEREREVAALTADRDRRRAQVGRFVQRVRARDTELQRRNEELTGLTQVVDAQVDEQRAKLTAAEKRLAERERESAELTADRDRRRAQAVGFVRRVRTRDGELARRNEELRGLAAATDGLRDQVQRLAGDVRGCDAEIGRLRNENTQLLRGSDQDPVVTASSHLVFLQLASGYELVEREGPPPPRHSPLEFPGLDGALVVAGSRPSPFPGDARPCIVAQLA